MASCELPHICEQLQCSICLDVFTDPVTTPCGHNFCATCLNMCWENSQDYRCPYCKETFSQRPDLKFNVVLKAIVFNENPEGLSTAGDLLSDELQCSICLDVFDNPVTTPCGHSFCDTCLNIFWEISHECTCPMCKETFNKKPDLKFNTGLKEIVNVFEKNSGYKREKVMEYSRPLEREDPEETLVKPLVISSSSDILTEELQCPDPFNYDCLYCEENIEMLDLKEMVQFFEICWCQSLNVKQVIMIEVSENANLNICKKHETILEMFYRGRADNTYRKQERNSEMFSGDCHVSVYLFCTDEDHRTHNTLSVESQEIKWFVEEKIAGCLPAPPAERKGRRKSIDIPPFMASCELLKFNTGLKEIVKVFERTSGYKQQTVMEYSPLLEMEDQEETLKPSFMASSSDILFNKPPTWRACGHNLNINHNTWKKHETNLELFYREIADNKYKKHGRNSEMFSRYCQASMFCNVEAHRTHPVDAAEMKKTLLGD